MKIFHRMGNEAQNCRLFTAREDNVQCRLLQKLQRLWLSHSQPVMSDWAGVLEVWTWTYYIAEANTQMGRKMRKNMHFEIKKWKKILRAGSLLRPVPIERDTSLPYPTPICSRRRLYSNSRLKSKFWIHRWLLVGLTWPITLFQHSVLFVGDLSASEMTMSDKDHM